MKLHSLKLKRIVAKVLYLLASQLCTLANKVLDKMIYQLLDLSAEDCAVITDEVITSVPTYWNSDGPVMYEGGEQDDC